MRSANGLWLACSVGVRCRTIHHLDLERGYEAHSLEEECDAEQRAKNNTDRTAISPSLPNSASRATRRTRWSSGIWYLGIISAPPDSCAATYRFFVIYGRRRRRHLPQFPTLLNCLISDIHLHLSRHYRLSAPRPSLSLFTSAITLDSALLNDSFAAPRIVAL